MKKFFSLLTLPMVAAGLVACSFDEGIEDTPRFEVVDTSGSESGSEESGAAVASDSTDNEPEFDSQSSRLKERDAEDFRATGFRYETTVAWGVRSPDGRVSCSLTEGSQGPWCFVGFENPPILPDPENPQWEANMVSYKEGAGFFPKGVVDAGDQVPSQQLEEGEKVDIDGVVFEAPNADEFTVRVQDHHFTVKDGGQFSADTYPLKPDSNGYAPVGTICGEVDTNFGREKVFVQTDGTNCTTAMDIVNKYFNYEWDIKEQNSRGILELDGWKCSYREPEYIDMPDPDARRLHCGDLSGNGRVILLDAEHPDVPKYTYNY
ncbi:hypothetical protein [Corynebacterium sp. HMSC062A03]|uniref:hypothetical protein n=1 Tax=Corynebacterium sp. HMSC062A03 TaxID=1739285 RepID=UPI00114CFC8E|nr:hypothetical protein [Corynebacterium sp. HMSC062A03]